MANPHPVPYSQANHKPECKCPACRKKTGKEKKRLNLVIEPDLESWLRAEAERQGRTVTFIIEQGIRKLQES